MGGESGMHHHSWGGPRVAIPKMSQLCGSLGNIE